MSGELSEHDTAVLNCVFNPNLPLEEATMLPQEELQDENDSDPQFQTAKEIEIKAVQTVESGNLNEGLRLLNEAISIAPKMPSLYNNRAYIYQFLRKFNEAFDDVTTAINLCSDKHRKTLCQARCQRGLLHRRAERNEQARQDFEIAAKMGNRFARGQLVELNPYAALCNQMLRQVTDALK
ncbi:tetratricopeptide repeat protein 36 homolog [Anoplophora glabripennis]|uniref:tetratricopeptide repeat protein 36 homolog n=1 Tax=Anoplophora glabripennis TaxID=217634 RepID=UPI000875A46F|nr:tetratricopeptide repeat protein 36 homolog [Anoplophora glabripennis]